jgi:uncharacterized membrane protein
MYRSRSLLTVLLLIIALSGYAEASKVYGDIYNIYGYEIEPADMVIVTINTTPEQKMVADAGTYEFSTHAGSYRIHARYYQENKLVQFVQEEIMIESEGEFRLDLILFPYIGEEEELLKESDEIYNDLEEDAEIIGDEDQEEEVDVRWLGYLGIGFLIAVIILVIYYIDKRIVERGKGIFEKKLKKTTTEEPRKRQVREDEDMLNVEEHDECQKQVLDILTKEKRITQKEIRKQLPASEAKISLVISDLESQGIVRKIRRGRSNIIVLNQKR